MGKKNTRIEDLELYIKSSEMNKNEQEIVTEQLDHIARELEELRIEKEKLQEEKKNAVLKYQFYESAIDALANPIFMKNAQGECVYFNSAYESYFGIEKALYLNKTVLELEFLPLAERENYHAEDLELIRTGNTKHYESEFPLPNGEVGQSLYWSTGFNVDGSGVKGLVGEIVDITVQKKLQEEISLGAKQLLNAKEQIEVMMSQDCLTGLYNRRVIERNIPKVDHIIYEEKKSVSLIIADLDDFKRTNDTFGHTVGDDVIVEFASILLSCNRKDDLVIRFGGEEFLMILFRTDIQEAQKIAERIRIRTEEKLILPDNTVNTASFGVSEITSVGTFYNAIKKADDALYSAKRSGKNKVVVQEL